MLIESRDLVPVPGGPVPAPVEGSRIGGRGHKVARPGNEIVGEAANGVEAVEKYKELSPDLVTMDIVMPFKSGIEATREIISFDKSATIVMCSALGQESLVIEAIDAGAADFVVKPFKSEDVQRVCEKALASR